MEQIEKDLRLDAVRLWRNSQVRRLVLALAAVAAAALLAAWWFTAQSAHRLERSWLTQQASILGRLAAEKPELAADWARLLAHPERLTQEDAQRGRQLAAQYGLTPELGVQLSPMLRDYRARTAWMLAAGLSGLFVLLAALLVRENRRHLLTIRKLAVSLESAVKHNKRMEFRIYEEGELGLLANSVQELAIRLQETIGQLRQDKEFLKDTIADISHQLKTPLSSLMIYIDLLQAGNVDPEAAGEFLQTCRKELDRMEWLTLTLLKIARLEADALPMQIRPAPIAETVERAIASVRPLAEDRQVAVRWMHPSSHTAAATQAQAADSLLPHDARWLAEAIANLIKNAVEISPPGSAVTVAEESASVFWRLTVEDQGPGIEEKHLPFIFRKFYRFSSGGSGVGLGLPLAKSIVERHGGMLAAASQPGAGARFVLTMPRHAAAISDKPYNSVSEHPGRL